MIFESKRIDFKELMEIESYLNGIVTRLYRSFEDKDSQKAGDLYDDINDAYDSDMVICEDDIDNEINKEDFRCIVIDRLVQYVREYEKRFHIYIEDFALEVGYRPHFILFSTEEKAPDGYIDA